MTEHDHKTRFHFHTEGHPLLISGSLITAVHPSPRTKEWFQQRPCSGKVLRYLPWRWCIFIGKVKINLLRIK